MTKDEREMVTLYLKQVLELIFQYNTLLTKFVLTFVDIRKYGYVRMCNTNIYAMC